MKNFYFMQTEFIYVLRRWLLIAIKNIYFVSSDEFRGRVARLVKHDK